MKYPVKKKRPKMGLREPTRIDCPGHLAWVRNTHQCAVFDENCLGKNQAHHVTTKGAGGGDDTAVPLCVFHHGEVHNIGIKTFEKKYVLDLAETAAVLWRQSRHRLKYESAA